MISVHEYTLPFREPFHTASGSFAGRKGLILTYTDTAIGTFSAEAAPLPGFSRERFTRLRQKSKLITENFHVLLKSQAGLSDLNLFLDDIESLPSLQYALSCIGLFYLSENKKGPEWFSQSFNPPKKVFVNDVIGILREEDFRKAISRSLLHGFRTLKVKCPYPFGYLPDVLRDYTEQFPDLKIRLDANQSWPEEALSEFRDAFHSIQIEYIEEPSKQNLSVVNHYPDLPIALDESLYDFNGLKNTLSAFPNLYIIIKPALFGSVFTLAETILQYRSMRNRVVFSTLLESAVGRSLILLLASTLGDHDLAHGMNTGKFFESDLHLYNKSFSEPSSAVLFPDKSIQNIPDNEHMKPLFTII